VRRTRRARAAASRIDLGSARSRFPYARRARKRQAPPRHGRRGSGQLCRLRRRQRRMRMRHVRIVCASVAAPVSIVVTIARALKVGITAQPGRHSVRLLVVTVIVVVASIVIVVIGAMISILLWVDGSSRWRWRWRTRVPGLRVRCWRRRVVRIRGIHPWTRVPRAAELVLAPILARAVRISPSGLPSELMAKRELGTTTRLEFTRLPEGWFGQPPSGGRGKMLALGRRRLSG
jgi:hypothetical protein